MISPVRNLWLRSSMTQLVSRLPLTKQDGLCGICGGQSGSGQCFSQNSACQCRDNSVTVPYPNFTTDTTAPHQLVNVKWSRYRPGVAQRVGRGLALLFHDRGTRRGWVVSSTPRPHFTLGKDPVPIVQEAGLAPGPVWTGGKYRPHRDSIPDHPARSQSTIGKRWR